MRRCYLMRCLFLVDRNKRHTATLTRNTRMETGRKRDSRIVQIVRFVRTAVRRFPLMRCIFRVDRSCIRVVSLGEYWTCMLFLAFVGTFCNSSHLGAAVICTFHTSKLVGPVVVGWYSHCIQCQVCFSIFVVTCTHRQPFVCPRFVLS